MVDRILRLGRYSLSLNRPLLMGVVNVTPDSFSDGDLYFSPERALARVGELAADGADLIDIGGESTRPGSEPVSAEEELGRVLPIVRGAVREYDLPLSVDTYKPEVADAVLSEGASVINDIMGVGLDPRLAEVAARHGAGLIIMHIRGEPRTMQRTPTYSNLMAEVLDELRTAIGTALGSGVAPDRIVIDPGVGFGKTLTHNLELLRRLPELAGLGFPVMIGTSRKSFIGSVLGVDVGERLMGTVGSVVAGYHHGADLFRVHDVRPCLEALRVAHSIATGSTEWGPSAVAARSGSEEMICGS